MEWAREIRRGQDVIASARDAVAKCFFSLLDLYQANAGQAVPPAHILELRTRSLELALALVGALTRDGLVPTFDQLREAIRIDAGV